MDVVEQPVYKLLTDRGIYFKPSGKDYLIKCLNPDHEDSNPSCRVDKSSGLAHCFSCGWKANIFKYFGIITTNTSVKTIKLKEKLRALTEEAKEISMPPGSTPYNESYRGISHQTLKKFGAFYTNDVHELSGRIVFPITDISDRVIAYIGRHTLSDVNPRYYITPKHVSLPLFPAKLQELSKSLVLVEGIFDMLNMFDKGVKNVACTFGTDTLTNHVRAKLLPYRAQGVTKVYIAFDGDKAGRTSASNLKPKLEEEGFECHIIDLPDDMDPGELNHEDVASIRNYIQ